MKVDVRKIYKQWKPLVLFSAILVVLLLVWLIASLIPGPVDPVTTTTTTAAVDPVYQTEMTDITKIDVSNASGTYTLVAEEVKDSAGKISQIWRIQGMEDYPFALATVESLAKVAGYVYASQEIATGVTDLAPFGLDQPSATIKAYLKNGETHRVRFGKELPSGYYDYAMLDDTGRICAVASTTADRVRASLLSLLDKSKVVGLAYTDLTGLTFERARDQLRLAAEIELIGEAGSGSEYLDFKITEPVRRSGTSESLTTLATESTAFTVAEFVELDPANLALYGLDKPQYTFILQGEEQTVTLLLGNMADSSNFYAMTDQVPAVFTVAASSFTMIDMKVIEMMDRFVSLESIWNVSKIEANILGTSFVTEIEMTKDQRADDEGVVFTLDGENARIFSETKKSLYSLFYQRLISVMIAGLDTNATPVNTRDARMVFHIKADEANDVAAYKKVVEFAKRDDYTYYVFYDGVYAGFYIESEAAFTSTRKDSEGIIVAYKMMRYAMANAYDGIFNTQEGYKLD